MGRYLFRYQKLFKVSDNDSDDEVSQEDEATVVGKIHVSFQKLLSIP
jgi:hypothetical protein